MVASGYAEPWNVAHRHLRDILDLDRHAVDLGEDDVLDVGDAATLGKIVIAAGIDQADAANVDRLLAHRDLAPADIDVGIAERRDDLRDRDVVGFELGLLDVDIELLGHAAPAVDLDDTRNRQKPAGDDPVLYGAQVGQPEVRRPGHLIAHDLAD